MVHEDYNSDCFMTYLFPRRHFGQKLKVSMVMHSCNRTLAEREIQRITLDTKFDSSKTKSLIRDSIRMKFL